MSEGPLRLRGVVASPGIAMGLAHVLDRRRAPVPRRRLESQNVEQESARLKLAMERARAEVELLSRKLGGTLAEEHRLVLDAHALLHRDELLVDEALRMVRAEQVNAEWAVRATVDALKQALQQADDAYLRERADDLEHVAERVLRELSGAPEGLTGIDRDRVLLAHDLGPVEVAQLGRLEVRAVVIERGSPTSHASLFARALGIPALVGAAELLREVATGDEVVVDALRGEVWVRPDADGLREAGERSARWHAFRGKLRAQKRATETLDGVRIVLRANVGSAEEAARAADEGADGVGLFRTEYLHLESSEPPDEESQLRVYAEAARAAGQVTFRTFDIGGDKVPTWARADANVLRARGLRAALARPDWLRTQMRAVLRAATGGTVRLMLPMVSTVDDARRARAEFDAARGELRAAGVAQGDVLLGAMIEVPSAVMIADLLAKEVDFFSVGTNDLGQYALAVDRREAGDATTLEPALLRLVAHVARAAHAAGTPLAMCGDLAGDPHALPLALGLGYTDLSVSHATLPLAREIVRRVSVEHAREAADEALACATATDVRAVVVRHFGEALGDLWEEHGI